jgi:hypothetical protein
VVAGTTRAHCMRKVQQWNATRARWGGRRHSGHEQGTARAESALSPERRDGRQIGGPDGAVIVPPPRPRAGLDRRLSRQVSAP